MVKVSDDGTLLRLGDETVPIPAEIQGVRQSCGLAVDRSLPCAEGPSDPGK